MFFAFSESSPALLRTRPLELLILFTTEDILLLRYFQLYVMVASDRRFVSAEVVPGQRLVRVNFCKNGSRRVKHFDVRYDSYQLVRRHIVVPQPVSVSDNLLCFSGVVCPPMF